MFERFFQIFKRFFRKKSSPEKENRPADKPKPAVNLQEEAKPKKEVKPRRADARVPFFSWQSFFVIAIGLIVGLAIGLGYWAFSPSSFVIEEPRPDDPTIGFLQSLGIGPPPPTEPWKSDIKIQVVNPGSTFVSLGQLANIGIYYSSKVKSLPFLQFLSQNLAKDAPQYNSSIDELDSIILTSLDPQSEQPTILLRVITPTADEAAFLSNYIPKAFQDFLVEEENNQQQQMRESLIKAIEDIKKAIIEAEQEVSSLEAQGISRMENDPKYIALNTKVQALETELVRQADILATMASQEDANSEISAGQEFENTSKEIDQTKADMLAAQQKLNELKERQSAFDFLNNPTYIKLTAEIAGLQSRINIIMNGGIDSVTGLPTTGLAEMIANGVTTGAAYEDAIKKLESTSIKLANDKKQLAVLESQISEEQVTITLDIQTTQAEIDSLNIQFTTLLQKLSELGTQNTADSPQVVFERTSAALAEARRELAALQGAMVTSQLPGDLDYQIAQARVDTLNDELATLNLNLSNTYVDTGGALQAIDSLAIGNPSAPEIVYPERVKARNALIIGAILGIIIAWAILNYRWLKKVFFPSDEPTEPQS